jgi:hypothetical protein
MTNQLDLRTHFAHEICAVVTRKLHGEELDAAIGALLKVRDELGHDRLRSLGVIVLNDGSALLRAGPEVLRHLPSNLTPAPSLSHAA